MFEEVSESFKIPGVSEAFQGVSHGVAVRFQAIPGAHQSQGSSKGSQALACEAFSFSPLTLVNQHEKEKDKRASTCPIFTIARSCIYQKE